MELHLHSSYIASQGAKGELYLYLHLSHGLFQDALKKTQVILSLMSYYEWQLATKQIRSWSTAIQYSNIYWLNYRKQHKSSLTTADRGDKIRNRSVPSTEQEC